MRHLSRIILATAIAATPAVALAATHHPRPAKHATPRPTVRQIAMQGPASGTAAPSTAVPGTKAPGTSPSGTGSAGSTATTGSTAPGATATLPGTAAGPRGAALPVQPAKPSAGTATTQLPAAPATTKAN